MQSSPLACRRISGGKVQPTSQFHPIRGNNVPQGQHFSFHTKIRYHSHMIRRRQKRNLTQKGSSKKEMISTVFNQGERGGRRRRIGPIKSEINLNFCWMGAKNLLRKRDREAPKRDSTKFPNIFILKNGCWRKKGHNKVKKKRCKGRGGGEDPIAARRRHLCKKILSRKGVRESMATTRYHRFPNYNERN